MAISELSAQEAITIGNSRSLVDISQGQSLQILKDSLGLLTPLEAHHSNQFVSTDVKRGNPKTYYWYKFNIHNQTDQFQNLILTHSRVSFSEVYEVKGNTVEVVGKSGLYRKASELPPGSSILNTTLSLAPGQQHHFLLRLINTTDSGPGFQINLTDKTTFEKEKRRRLALDCFFFGTVLVVVIYSFILFLVHRYQPYLWLALFALGIGLYGFNINVTFIEWVLPENPKLGINLSSPFTQMGSIGMSLLVLTFLKLKKRSKRWYRIFSGLLVFSIVRFFVGFYLTWVHEMFGVNTSFIIITVIVESILIITFLLRFRKQLDKTERVFAIGMALYCLALITGFLSWTLPVAVRTILGAVSPVVSVSQVLAFAMALGFKMRQHEIDKNKALNELNAVLTSQKEKVEQEVVERTAEINQQKLQLEERNERIETLFREIHHRVKNNLQLISSLLNMQQEWSSTEDPAKAIEDSRSRVVAMSMIHQFLYRTDDITTINFEAYARELASKLDEIQLEKVSFQLETTFDRDFIFDIDTSISLGLILNELITNSYKHAFHDKIDLVMGLQLKQINEEHFEMIYSDNGEAIQQPIAEVVKKGFGLRLASRLARQLQGAFAYEFREKNRFTITFMSKAAREALADAE